MRTFQFFLLLQFGFIISVHAGPIDSLQKILQKVSSSTEKIDLLLKLSIESMKQDINLALDYGQQAHFLAKTKGNPQQQINASRQLATVFYNAGLTDKAIEWFVDCRNIAKQSSNKVEVLTANINIGVVRLGVEDYSKAREIYKEGESLIFSTYKSLGKQVPVDDLIKLYSNLALCSFKLNEISEGFDYISKAERLIDSARTSDLIYARLLQVWGVGFIKDKKPNEALSKLQLAKNILEKAGDKIQLTLIRSFIGEAYLLSDYIKSAIREYETGYREAESLRVLIFKVQFSASLAENYQKLNNKQAAYKYLQVNSRLKDQLKVANTKEQLVRAELIQEFEKREKVLKASHDSKQKNYAIVIVIVISISVVFFFSIIYYRRKYSLVSLAELKSKLEAERLEFEHEKLKSQLSNKENEVMYLEKRISKNMLIEQLVDNLQSVDTGELRNNDPGFAGSETKSVSLKGKIWDEFEIRFLKNHTGYFERLFSAHPNLTPNERRLCSFLRLDMTTKEIAIITGQTVRAVEIARTRLRKKLDIRQGDISLFDYLSTI